MNKIKQLREYSNMTQEELADKLGGAKSSIAMYEKGDRKPSMEVLIKLSEIFNCSIDYLTGRSFYKNYDDFVKLDEYVLNYMKNKSTEGFASLISNTLNYINSHKNEDIDKIINDAVKKLSSKDQEELTRIISHLYYRYHGKIPEKTDIRNNDEDSQGFRFAYHKETDGLTDEEIVDALRFYKQMKAKYQKNNK